MTIVLVIAVALIGVAAVASVTFGSWVGRSIADYRAIPGEIEAGIAAIDGVESVRIERYTAGVTQTAVKVTGVPDQSAEAAQDVVRQALEIAAPHGGGVFSYTQQHRDGSLEVDMALSRDATGVDVPVATLVSEIEAGASSALARSRWDDPFECTSEFSSSLEEFGSVWQATAHGPGDCSTLTRRFAVESHPLVAYVRVAPPAIPVGELVTLLPHTTGVSLSIDPGHGGPGVPDGATMAYAITLASIPGLEDISMADPGTAAFVSFLEGVRADADPRRVVRVEWPASGRPLSIWFDEIGVHSSTMESDKYNDPESVEKVQKIVSLMD